MSRQLRPRAARLTTRPELSVSVPVTAGPSSQQNTPLSPSPKRRWFARLASLVSRLRPAPRSPASSSSSGTSPSTTTSSAFSCSPAALTATWVNTSAQTAPATLNPKVWPASAISLQNPPRTHAVSYSQDRTRHQSLGAVMQAQQPQPVPLYSIPPGPTALSPSPYMLGRAASASAATIARVPRERETRGRRRGASISHLQQYQTQPVPPPPPQALHYHHHGNTFPPTTHSAPAVSSQRSLPVRPPIPSIPRVPSQSGSSRPPVSYSQMHGWYSPDSSPSTIRRESFDSAPSQWATPESQPGRRLSGATCVSSGTFGV